MLRKYRAGLEKGNASAGPAVIGRRLPRHTEQALVWERKDVKSDDRRVRVRQGSGDGIWVQRSPVGTREALESRAERLKQGPCERWVWPVGETEKQSKQNPDLSFAPRGLRFSGIYFLALLLKSHRQGLPRNATE